MNNGTYRHTEEVFIADLGTAMLIMSAIIQKYCKGAVEVTQDDIEAVAYGTIVESAGKDYSLKLEVIRPGAYND